MNIDDFIITDIAEAPYQRMGFNHDNGADSLIVIGDVIDSDITVDDRVAYIAGKGIDGRILIIDNDEHMGEQIARLLAERSEEERKEIRVIGCGDSQAKSLLEALTSLEPRRPTFVARDIHFQESWEFEKLHPKHEHHVPRPKYKHKLKKNKRN